MSHTHSDRLERWLGSAFVNEVSARMRHWYGPPIVLSGVPGPVYAARGGDFVGTIRDGAFASYLDFARDRAKRAWARWRREQYGKLNVAGFASLSDLLLQARIKRQTVTFSKGRTAFPGGGSTCSLWTQSGQPVNGSAGAAAPGGTAHTSANTGAAPFINPQVSGDGTYFVRAEASAFRSTITSTLDTGALLLYDRLFSVAKTMSSTTTEAVTGVPTRYQNTTQGAEDSAEGNFVFPEVSSTLSATAHNWTVCQYTNQAGSTAKSFPSVAGSNIQTTGIVDLPINQWFMALAAGDTGVKALTQMQCSASVTGTLTFVLGHPLAWVLAAQNYLPTVFDGVVGPFNMPRVFDNACLALLDVNQSSAINANNYDVTVDLVQG